MNKLITIVETNQFINFAKASLSNDEKNELINYIAQNPKVGDLITGTGGLRKLRWARANQGKSGGFRIVYYYYNDDVPVFLISGFAKNEMENISNAFKNECSKFLKELVKQYKEAKNDKV